MSAVPKLLTTTSELTQTVKELSYYRQIDDKGVAVSATTSVDIQQCFDQHCYLLPLGELRLLNSTLYLPTTASQIDIEVARKNTIKSALMWQNRCLQHDAEDAKPPCCVLVIDIQLNDTLAKFGNSTSTDINSNKKYSKQFSHSFGANYFMEELVLDISETSNMLPVFS